MLISATGALAAEADAPILYRGAYREILPQMAEDGFAGVELHILNSCEINRAELWTLLEQNGLRLTSIGTGSIYTARRFNLVDHDSAIRQLAIDHLEQHMITLEPSHGLVIVGLIAGRNTDCQAPLQTQKQRLADSLHILEGCASRHGVSVGLEMMNRYESDFLHTIAEGMAFLDDVGLKHTMLHIDSASMNISETDIGAAIRAGRGRVGHVHLADNDRWYPGHGHYNFSETLQALRDIGYEGALALEEKAYPTPHAAAKISLRYLSDLLRQLS